MLKISKETGRSVQINKFVKQASEELHIKEKEL